MAGQRLRILLCGEFDDVEMRPVADWAKRLAPAVEFRRVERLSDATTHEDKNVGDETEWAPDLIVVAQLRPEQFSQTEVRQLQARFPLARCVCCYGAWCESDGRNSTLWPEAVRVSARSACSRIRREIAVLANQRPPLPLTASRDEIFEFDSVGGWNECGAPGNVRVISPDRELRVAFEELLESGGFDVAKGSSDPEVGAVVWDVDPWRAVLADEIRAFRRAHSQVRVVALMNFGHPRAAAAVLECGADCIVAKLASAELLFKALQEEKIGMKPQMNADERR